MTKKQIALTGLAVILFSLHPLALQAAETNVAPEATKAAPPAQPAPSAAPAAPVAKAPAPVAPKKTVELKNDLYGKQDRPLGDFMVGPVVTLLSLPRPLGFGAEAKYADVFGLSAGYGFLPEFTISSVKIKLTGWDVRAKWYPFKGAFFIGAGFGSQNLTASTSQVISGFTTIITGSQDNTFVAPHVGWNWIWDSGFFMGMDLGVQLSLSRTTTITPNTTNTAITSTAEYQKNLKDITDKADQIGKTPLPLLSLIKIGYFF